MIEIAERPRVGLASAARRARAPLAFLRRLDWVLMAATFALVGYGLGSVSGITRFDVPGDPNYYVVRQAIAAGIGVVGLVVAMLVPTDVCPPALARHLRRDARR